MGTVVLDTSVVLALFDPEDSLHVAASAAARRCRDAGDRFVLPASVLAETLVGVARLGEGELVTRWRAATAAFGTPHPADETVAVTAARLRARHRTLRLPDALVLATADAARAQSVLTGDKRWRHIDPRVDVIS